MKSVPDSIVRWLPGRLIPLGTDGFGRSGTHEELRDFFEVDARHIVVAALSGLAERGDVEANVVSQAIDDLEINPEKLDPLSS
jgi:pyruvate dehydrogenase E1 component